MLILDMFILLLSVQFIYMLVSTVCITGTNFSTSLLGYGLFNSLSVPTRSLLLLTCLLLMVGTASCAEDDYRFDPAKRIPLLTEKNWADWSWRVAAAFSVITGSAANFLFHRHSSADVGSAGVSEDLKN